ncbi:MAG: HNH endonuclease signature motif containing protein [Chthoniobacterales bacterium]
MQRLDRPLITGSDELTFRYPQESLMRPNPRAGLEFPEYVKNEAFQRNWERSKGGGYWCEWCYFTNANRAYFEVDHLIPVVKAGKPTLDNACILCVACNQSKGQHGWPRHGAGLAYRAPTLNMAPPSVRVEPLSWDDLVRMAQRKPPFVRED